MRTLRLECLTHAPARARASPRSGVRLAPSICRNPRISGIWRTDHERPATAVAAARPRALLDALYEQPRVQAFAAHDRFGRRHVLHHGRRQESARRPGDAVVRQRRPLPAENRRGDTQAGGHPRFFLLVLARPSAAVRSRAPRRRTRARGHGAGVLRQFGLRGGGHGAENRARLPSTERRGHAHALHRPRARLSRRQLRRHFGGRGARQPQGLRRDAARRGPSAPHPRPGAQRLLARPAGRGRRVRRRAGAAHHSPARCVQYRRGDRRAGGGRGRRAGSAAGLSAAAAPESATSTASC